MPTNNCPEEYRICYTEEQYEDLVELMEESQVVNPHIAHHGSDSLAMSDAEAAINFTWEVLFLSPWELAYIAIPMGVLAFYGLSIYALFKYIQKRFS